MAERTYPWGYSGDRLTLAQMNTRWSWYTLHPEFRRRLIAMFNAHPTGGLGCGGGARSTEQQLDGFLERHVPISWATYLITASDKRVSWKEHAEYGQSSRYWKRISGASYAPPGRSYHEESFPRASREWALAVDAIGWTDHWMRDNCGRFGLRTLLNTSVSEEWHLQPVEVPVSRSDMPYDQVLTVWDLPGSPPVPPIPPPPTGVLVNAQRFAFRKPKLRVVDTRRGDQGGRMAADTLRQFVLADSLINGAIGVKVNVTVVGTVAAGFLTLWDSGDKPEVSDINWSTAGAVIANQVDIMLGTYGVVQVYAKSDCDVILDVVGYWFP